MLTFATIPDMMKLIEVRVPAMQERNNKRYAAVLDLFKYMTVGRTSNSIELDELYRKLANEADDMERSLFELREGMSWLKKGVDALPEPSTPEEIRALKRAKGAVARYRSILTTEEKKVAKIGRLKAAAVSLRRKAEPFDPQKRLGALVKRLLEIKGLYESLKIDIGRLTDQYAGFKREEKSHPPLDFLRKLHQISFRAHELGIESSQIKHGFRGSYEKNPILDKVVHDIDAIAGYLSRADTEIEIAIRRNAKKW